MQTVYVEAKSVDAIKMVWSKNVSTEDVRASFKELNRLLSLADHPMFLIVDILAHPNFPLPATLTGALSVYRSFLLRECLVIGSNDTAHLIERTLFGATGRSIVRWFENEAEVDAYMAQAGPA